MVRPETRRNTNNPQRIMITDYLLLKYYIRAKNIVREIETNALSFVRPLVKFAELHPSLQHVQPFLETTPSFPVAMHISLQGSRVPIPQVLSSFPKLSCPLMQ